MYQQLDAIKEDFYNNSLYIQVYADTAVVSSREETPNKQINGEW